MHAVPFEDNFNSWRQAVREQISQDRKPQDLLWEPAVLGKGQDRGLFALEKVAAEAGPVKAFSVPRQFMELAQYAFYHRSEKKWSLLYRVLWRLLHENKQLLDISIDDDVSELMLMARQVRRDAHKMKAFVRFRKVEGPEGDDHYVAWHQPDHPLLALVVPFFKDRFGSLKWTLLTPDASAVWDREKIAWGPGCEQSAGPDGDGLEELWGTYYKSIFNPARVKVKAMRAEMPTRYWKSLPEAKLIDELLEGAEGRVSEMIKAAPRDATSFVPLQADLPALKEALSRCQACDLCHHATQAVFSEGSLEARIALIGEQPGDNEDREGRPFIGPAGQILNKALAEAGLDRSQLYLTNAVKHFKHKKEGKRRLHEKPSAREVAVCKPWLKAEMELISAEVVVCLGLTAALSVFGKSLRLKDVRGTCQPSTFAPFTIVTHHPSHILRLTSQEEQAAAYRELVDDLRRALNVINV